MKHGLKSVMASLLVTAALAAPAVVLSTPAPPYKAELYLSGASLELLPGGTVQAIFDVSVDKLPNCTGAEFLLTYNEDYMIPSYIGAGTETVGGTTVVHEQNEKMEDVGHQETDGFFRVDGDLFGVTDDSGELVNPFSQRIVTTSGVEYYSYVDTGSKTLHMRLQLDKSASSPISEYYEENGELPNGEIEVLEEISKDENEKAFVVNHQDQSAHRVTLGQLSFQVNKEHLPEMIELFANMGTTTVPEVINPRTGEKVKLLYINDDPAQGGYKDNWAMYAYTGPAGSMSGNSRFSPGESDAARSNVENIYEVEMDGKTPVEAKLANPAFTKNAYQVFVNGDEGDIALALGRWSPMVTVTYADGSQENLIVPWGEAGSGYDPGLTADPYDPTGGHYYPYQFITIHGRPFHEPVRADVTVTPVTLVEVSAPDLERSYTPTQAVDEVTSGMELELPTEARLVTDIMPGGVSLTMDIPGWRPTKEGSVWPVLTTSPSNAETLMNSLRAETYAPLTGIPYWPDNADRDELETQPEKFCGLYKFQMAEGYGGAAKAGFTRTEIQAKYPWMTVPEPEYAIEEAHRHIVPTAEFTDSDDYVATYKSTVTDDNGQPTVTLNVRRKDGEPMAAGSVFRVWLPNGQELGTGMTSKNVDLPGTDKSFTVPDWFGLKDDDGDGVPDVDLIKDNRPITTTGGWYQVKPDRNNTGKLEHFDLIVNPDEPLDVAHYSAERETLRRYINLGGWFRVSVCEDVDAKNWSEQIPVYVEPRRNEYIESKTYNFLGDNAGLMALGSPVGTTVTLPEGFYTPVGDTGLPLYVTPGGVEDERTDPSVLDAAGRPIYPRYEESYGLKTIFDGQTGAQPGELFRFTVDAAGNVWAEGTSPGGTDALVGGHPITQYGATDFRDGSLYQGFGYVHQPLAGSTVTYTGTLRTQGQLLDTETPGLYEAISLKCVTPEAVITSDADGNVDLATYDTRMVGYESRQEYVFVLKNEGTMDIYGLTIDGLTDGYPQDTPGGRFEMLQAPASYLAPGESTTFILTYVYDLAPNNAVTRIPEYRDTLYVTSDRHPIPGKHAGAPADADYLLDFDAAFTVADTALHKVDVVVYPETVNDSDLNDDGDYAQPVTYPMGTADVIIGPQLDPPALTVDGNTYDLYTMNYTSATRSYPKAEQTASGEKIHNVYVVVRPKDMYTVDSVTYTDTSGVTYAISRYGMDASDPTLGEVPLTKTTEVDGRTLYVNSKGEVQYSIAVLDDGTEVYSFPMDEYDVTVTVRFREDVLSKLRLSSLIDFSAGPNLDDAGNRIPRVEDNTSTQFGWGVAGSADKLLKEDPTGNPTDTVAPENTYEVWRKSFTQEELDAAEEWQNDVQVGGTKPSTDLYLMTKGRAIPESEEGKKFVSSENHYLVVIPYEADRSQIEVVLRALEVEVDGVEYDATDANQQSAATPDGRRRVNLDIEPEVAMARYDARFLEFSGFPDNLNNPWRTQIYGVETGDTATPTTHTSPVFDSPEPGTSCYVRIRLGAPEYPGSTTTVYTYYYVEIHRRPQSPEVEMHYGNSPYGMIMNGPKFVEYEKDASGNPTAQVDAAATAQRREDAKAAFRKGYTFRGLGNADVPQVVLDNAMNNVTYWREAWVKNGRYYEPESGLGRDWVYLYDDQGAFTGNEWRDIPSVYDPAENLDLNDYAYFAILGEDMREPGVISALDSSGRPVDLATIAATAQVTLLDTSQTLQAQRFSGTGTATLDLGTAGKTLTTVAGQGLADIPAGSWPVSSAPGTDDAGEPITVYSEVTDIRPGRYSLVYSYVDFDGKSVLQVERPFVILSPVGDVDADLERSSTRSLDASATQADKEATDEYILENRVTDPLGYTVQGTRSVQATDPATGLPAVDAAGDPVMEDVFIYDWANIFKFRVCDVNNDRNINNIDGNLIDKNARAGNGWLRFYHPTRYGLPTT